MQEGRRRSTIRGRSSRRLGGTCIGAGGGEEKGGELIFEDWRLITSKANGNMESHENAELELPS